MKRIVHFAFLALVSGALSQTRAGTLVAPNGFEKVEGFGNARPIFGGSQSETQILYGSQNFSLFPPEGAYIVELRFRLDGDIKQSLFGTADLGVRLSTTDQNPSSLDPNFALNIGADRVIALPRQTVQLTQTASPDGLNSFSVVIPLPNRFFYKPGNGNLLVEASVFGVANLANVDWNWGSSTEDGVTSAIRPMNGGTTLVLSGVAPITEFVFEVPETSTTSYLIIAGVLSMLKLSQSSRSRSR